MIALAVVIGIFAVILANSYFSGVEEKQAAIAEEQRLVRIVVATQPLEFGAPLTQQNLKLANYPATSVPEGAFTSIAEALKDNRVALRPIVINEPVLRSKVSGTDGRATLAAILPDGFRAMSIPISNTTGVSGFVLPGTMVDVMLLRQIEGDGATQADQRADMILENVQVLAIDQTANDKEGNPIPGRTATVAVTPTDAQRLAMADRMGTLYLTLRKVEAQAGSAPAEGERVARTMTSRQLGLPRLVIGGRSGGGGGGGGGGGSAAPAPSLPQLASISPPAAARTPSAPIYTGPAMTVVRGTEPTSYQVGSLGGPR
ncbi:Flp pilus assembly protein CpaB [Tsuneonella aeria]|uniref:Flp pilus assembly protein CpaB n=1 Tax=Tsuneonella aeria TaxID=1837929 RepID=UPI001925B7C6|nr:Flp pilus assembly protein CpaB [Tsuneonella aeria]